MERGGNHELEQKTRIFFLQYKKGQTFIHLSAILIHHFQTIEIIITASRATSQTAK